MNPLKALSNFISNLVEPVLSENEKLVLTALLSNLDEGLSGIEIIEHMEQSTGNYISASELYSAVKSLKRRELIYGYDTNLNSIIPARKIHKYRLTYKGYRFLSNVA